ncbi:MAG TPA: DUF6259 domain-containing protein [Clostridiales bacterium]|nr:DUF6259 domain-containing protein [Clostridiales bacterium]HQK73888.1 DUF6259 domain-containing protein [Clostridiales bacterium]
MMKNTVAVENKHLAIRFSNTAGTLAGLFSKTAGKEFLSPGPHRRSPFAIYEGFSKPFAFLDNTVPGEPADFADRILLPARPVFEPFDGGLEILYLLSETLTARLRVELDGITSRWRLSLRNAGAETLSVLPVFPLIGGITLGKDARMLAMNQAGSVCKIWGFEGGAYGNGGRNSAQLGCFFEKDACLGFYFEDGTFGPKDIRYKKPAVEVRRFPEKTIAPGETLVVDDTVILLYRGSWHQTAKSYAAWMRHAFPLPKVPSWLGKTQSFAGAWFEKRGKPNYEGPNLSEPLDSFLEMDRHFAGGHPHLTEYAFFSELSAKDYGDRMYIYGSNRRHTDGWNIVRADLGGAEALKTGIEKVHALGKRVTLYVEGLIVPGESELFTEKPEARDWLIANPDGTNDGPYTGQNFAHMCCGSEGWQDHLAAMCARLMRETGADGIRLDSFSFYFWPCYNPAHKHRSPFDCNAWMQTLLSKVASAVRAVNPDALLATEAPADYNRLWFNTALDANFVKRCLHCQTQDSSVFRVMFPEFYMPRINGGQVMESLMLMPDGCFSFTGNAGSFFSRWHEFLPQFNDVLAKGEVCSSKPVCEDEGVFLNAARLPGKMLIVGARPDFLKRYAGKGRVGLQKARNTFEVSFLAKNKPDKITFFDIERGVSFHPDYNISDGVLRLITDSNWFAVLLKLR